MLDGSGSRNGTAKWTKDGWIGVDKELDQHQLDAWTPKWRGDAPGLWKILGQREITGDQRP